MKNKNNPVDKHDLKPYQRGLFEYNECFLGKGGFLSPESNEEKHLIALYLQALARELGRHSIVFGKSEPIHWLELGIGDGSSTQEFILALSKIPHGDLIIHGSDIQIESQVLARKRLARLPHVCIAELLQKDAFSDSVIAEKGSCDFALLSHFVYHVKSTLDGVVGDEKVIQSKIQTLIQSVMIALKPDGFALCFHESEHSDMFGTFAKHFGDVMSNAPQRIAQAAAAINKQVIHLPMESRLYFPVLSNTEIALLKDLKNWQHYSEDTPQASWIKKILFALHIMKQRNEQGQILHESGVVTLAEQGRLPEVIDDLCAILKQDDYGYYFVIRSEMQVILNNSALKPEFELALNQVREQIPNLNREARKIMISYKKIG